MFTTLFLAGLSCTDNGPQGEPASPPSAQEERSDKSADGHAHAHPPRAKGEKPPAPVEMGPIPEGAKVSFGEPADGAKVTSPVHVVMQVEGMEMQPAGEILPGKGHHHILIDVDAPAKGTAVAKDAQHLHFGKAQTETELALSPGEHTLRLQFANGAHISYGPQLTAAITVTVE
jgi:hypothetical protein